MTEKITERIFLVGRIMLSLMFIESCADKLMHWDFYVTETAGKNIPFPPVEPKAP